MEKTRFLIDIVYVVALSNCPDTNIQGCHTCGQKGHFAAECTGKAKEPETEFDETEASKDTPFQFLSISILREYLAHVCNPFFYFFELNHSCLFRNFLLKTFRLFGILNVSLMILFFSVSLLATIFSLICPRLRSVKVLLVCLLYASVSSAFFLIRDR